MDTSHILNMMLIFVCDLENYVLFLWLFPHVVRDCGSFEKVICNVLQLLPEEAQHIISSKNCEAYEDLSATASGKSAVTTNLSSFLNQASAKSLPHAYLKAGQELLEIVDNGGGVFPLPSEHLLNILDEASEKTFLCGEPPLATQNYGYQADAGKNQCEEKNLIASLSFIVEQTLVSSSTLNMMYNCLSCGGHFCLFLFSLLCS
jgi:hypothetical protein